MKSDLVEFKKFHFMFFLYGMVRRYHTWDFVELKILILLAAAVWNDEMIG
jgi:hypothetical protein